MDGAGLMMEIEGAVVTVVVEVVVGLGFVGSNNQSDKILVVSNGWFK